MSKLYGTEATLLSQTELAFLDSSQVRRASRGVTLDASEFTADADDRKIVLAGTVVGKNSVSGLWEELDLGVAATASIGAAVDNDLFVLTATVAGITGNAIYYELLNGQDSRASTEVEYDTHLSKVSVHLKNDGAAVTATAAQVNAAIIAGAVASVIEIGAADAIVKLTAKTAGFLGNLLSCSFLNPGPNSSLAVDVVDEKDIRVTLATSAASAAVAATKVFYSAVTNKELTITALVAGTAGNDLSIELIDPSGNDAVLGINYDDGVITVNHSTGGAGAITSTAKDIADAMNADVECKALVVASYDGTGLEVTDAQAEASLTGGTAAGAGTITTIASEVIAAINADPEAKALVYAENGTDSDGTDDMVAAAATFLLLGNDLPPFTAANGTGSDGSGVVAAVVAALLAGGTAQNVPATRITAETVELTNGDTITGVFDSARVRESRLQTTIDSIAKAQLEAVGFTFV